MGPNNLSWLLYNHLIKSQKRRRVDAGFSLIEVFVVMSLTAFLAALTVPAITFGNNPLRESSNRIAASFKWARAQAIASTSAVRIRPISNTEFVMETGRQCADIDPNNWTIISDQVERNGQLVYEDLSFDAPAQLTDVMEDGVSVDVDAWDICFNSRGIADKPLVLTMENTGTNEETIMTVFVGGTLDLSDIN